jgi:MFS family permease
VASSGVSDSAAVTPTLGIRPNLAQFLWLVTSTILVGGVVGTERAVVPLLGRDVYHVGTALTFSFIVSFGVAKALMNSVAGQWSDRAGRKVVMVTGWLVGIPMVLLVLLVHQWSAVVAANLLLGIQQAFTWTMTITAQLDLVGPRQRGLAMGINEATGYIGVAVASAAAALVASHDGLATAPFLLTGIIVASGLLMALGAIHETRGHVTHEAAAHGHPVIGSASYATTFWETTVVNPTLSTATLAGLVNKLADTVAWGALPIFFAARGVPLATIGILSGTYAFTWGIAQFGTGILSDLIGRKPPIVAGLLLLGSGIALMATGNTVGVWGPTAIVMGFGMALLYPNLNAVVADLAPPERRGAILGVYRLWRDGGYAVGGLLVGLGLARWGGPTTLWATAAVVGGTAILALARMRESHPHSARVGRAGHR